MNRKNFLGTVAASAGSMLVPGVLHASADSKRQQRIIIPPYLQPGDAIGITCPAGYITEKDIQPAVAQIQSWGFQVRQGNTVGKKDFTYGGTDEERRADFQQMMDDISIKAILCGRGGYGAVRIIDQLDFSRFRKHPKWVIGFSDITAFHSHLQTSVGVASIHSKMCNSFPEDWTRAEPIQVETILSIRKTLSGEQMQYAAAANEKNRKGVAEGILTGGNLRLIETLAGTASDINTRNKILFVEDTGEPLYNIDRMFWNLQRTGKLSGLAALIVGGFTGIKPEAPGEEFGRTVQEIVLDRVKEFAYPVCFDFPVGHQRNNIALKCGVRHRITVSDQGTKLETV